MTTELTSKALRRAFQSKRLAPGLIHDSDHCSQYCAHSYVALLNQFGMKVTMSRKGNCYDNAPMESLWGSLKNELIYHRQFQTRTAPEEAIQKHIEIFYNRQRRHSRLGNIAPAIFAEKFSKEQKAVSNWSDHIDRSPHQSQT